MQFDRSGNFRGEVVCLFVAVGFLWTGSQLSAKDRGEKAGETRNDNIPKITLVWCPPGNFTMGSPKTEQERYDDEGPVHVNLTSGFWLGQTEVTQAQWQAVMDTAPWKGWEFIKEGPNYPATHLDFSETLSFCQKLTEEERKAGRLPEGWEYTLPTEAQWEYACRAGTTTGYSFGDDATKLGEYAWFEDNADKIDEDYLVSIENVNRVARGGCWLHRSRLCRSANRFQFFDFAGGGFMLGFRVALVSSHKTEGVQSK